MHKDQEEEQKRESEKQIQEKQLQIEYSGADKPELGVVIQHYGSQNVQVHDVEKFKLACPQINRWEVSQLSLYKKQFDHVILSIMNIKLNRLARLDLRFNKITSIQAITSIYMPALTHLMLDDNLISCLKPLHKLSVQLCYLSISNNLINQLNCLGQTIFKLKQIAIEYVPDPNMLISLKDLVKLQCFFTMETVRILSTTRINENAVTQKLKIGNSGLDIRKKKH